MSTCETEPVRDAIEAAVAFDRVTKRYGASVTALDAVCLYLTGGRILALLGPSGCGKTTALRLIAGLEAPDAGSVVVGGQRVAGEDTWVPPETRGVGMVFQQHALFPHLTASENIAFPLTRWSRKERRARAHELLEAVGLGGMGERYPHQLSGGQQQRVALARALAPRPRVVLLDEPFANLDAALRRGMRTEVGDILRAAGATAIFVTHDQEEAFSLADTIAVMEAGRVLQTGAPREIYAAPATRSVATLVGESNFVPGIAHADHVECALGVLALARPAEGPVDILVRPEAMVIDEDAAGEGLIERVTYLGHDQLVRLRWRGEALSARLRPHVPLRPGQRVHLTVAGPVVAFPR